MKKNKLWKWKKRLRKSPFYEVRNKKIMPVNYEKWLSHLSLEKRERWEKVKDNKQPEYSPLQCCELARVEYGCFCIQKRFCPVHDEKCLGSHE